LPADLWSKKVDDGNRLIENHDAFYSPARGHKAIANSFPITLSAGVKGTETWVVALDAGSEVVRAETQR
jgi:hypothetical protein